MNLANKSKEEQYAWAAGFFDGEGYIGCRLKGVKGRKLHTSIALTVAQKDRRVLDQFQCIFGLGKVYATHRTLKGQPYTTHSWRLTSIEGVQAIVEKMWPYLGPVKRKQAKDAFEFYNTGINPKDRPEGYESGE